MFKLVRVMCVAGALTLVLGLGRQVRFRKDSEQMASGGHLELVRSQTAVAENLKRKQGDTELGAKRRATIEGRDAYWKKRLGDVPSGYLTRLKREAERIPPLSADKDGGLTTWSWLGPGNIGGRVRSMIIDPLNPQNMWLGSVSGGIWQSSNGGNSWAPVDDFMANLAVSCMAITPDRQYLFAGTGEGFPGALFYQGEGIFRSGDMGQTWQQLTATNTFNFEFVTRLAVHPSIDGRVYAITNIRVSGPNNGILYRSDDDGLSWSADLVLGTDGYDVKITDQTASGTPWIMVGGNRDMFLSTDDGATFTSMVTGPIASALPNPGGRVEVAFGTSSGSDPVLYASLVRNNGELWRSTDGGSTWSLRNTGSDIFKSTSNQGNYDNVLWIEPGNPNRLIWGGVDLWVSNDGGATLGQSSDWAFYHENKSAHADQHLIMPHPNYSVANPAVYFGNDGGLQYNANIWSNGPKEGWVNLANGLGITQFYQGAASLYRGLTLGGAQDNSFLQFNNGNSESWFQETTGDGGYVAVNQSDPATFYVALQNLDLRRTRNGGGSYTDIGKNIPDVAAANGSVKFIAPFMIDNFTPTTLYAGGASLWVTSDEGNNWLPIRTGLGNGELCSAIAQSASDPTRLYAGYDGGTVSRSISNIMTWFNIHNASVGMPATMVADIAVNPTDPDDVVVAYTQVGTNSLWRSFDGGSNWQVISSGGVIDLPATAINTVTFHPSNSAWIYVGTDAGVFATEDGGQHWSRTTSYAGSEGPANVKIMDLFWGGDDLYAATWGRGMFRSTPRVTIYVDAANAGNPGQVGTDLNPYELLSTGEGNAGHGTNIIVEGGTYDDTNGLLLNKRGLINNRNGTALIK